MGRHRKKVIAIGMACLDQLMVWEDVTAPIQRNRLVGYDLQGGGMAATALVAVARLGGRAEIWAAVGDDWAGDLILRDLAAEGVDTRCVRRVPGRRGPLMIVCVDQRSGERCFFHTTGYCRAGRPVGNLKRLASAGCLLVDNTRPESEVRAAREARRLGVPVVGDFGWMDENVPNIMKYVDYAILSENGARGLPNPSLVRPSEADPRLAGPSGGRPAGGGGPGRVAPQRGPTASGSGAGRPRAGRKAAPLDLGQACRTVRAMGPRCAVITLGGRGLVFLDGDRFGCMGAFSVKVADTTGAGDVFHGAFCQGLVDGLPLEQNLRFASAAAAMKCRRLGGRAGIPTRSEVLRFLKSHGAR
jgi:sugar/nucleoside kinase (ribokinase family)